MAEGQSLFGRMGARIKNRLAPEPVDPARFNDPVAMETDWTFLRDTMGGTWFASHGAVVTGADRLEFRMTRQMVLILWALPLVLISMAVAMGTLYKNIGFVNVMILAGIVGIPSAIPVGIIYFMNSTRFFFDKRLGCFWKGRRSPDNMVHTAELENGIELSRLHAIQLIARWVVSGSGYMFQLNAVLEDGTRIGVVNHGSEKSIRKDAATLSAFLEKPVWDAIEMA